MPVDLNDHTKCRGCGGPVEAGRTPAPESAIGRRAFLVQSGILAAVAALEACGLSSGGEVTAPTLPSNTTISISNYPSLANVGGVVVLTIGSAPIAIVRTGDTSFLALSRICPHQGGLIQLSGSDFVCTRHGATFDIDGGWIGGQRTSNMRQYTTSYDATSGTLTIS
jgi:nitrite reductase/ring-hydroxylating ferredoxin subunit